MSCWAYFDSTSQGRYTIYSQQDNGGDTVLYMIGDRNGNDNINFSIWNGSDWIDAIGPSISSGSWLFLTSVWESDGTMRIYVNGSEKGNNSGTSSVDTSDSLGEQILGVYDYGGSNEGYFTGKISEVRVYSKALSSTEIQKLYDRAATKGVLKTGSKSS